MHDKNVRLAVLAIGVLSVVWLAITATGLF